MFQPSYRNLTNIHDEITKLFRGERLLVRSLCTILRCVKTEGTCILLSSKDPFRGHHLKLGKPVPPSSPPHFQRYINLLRPNDPYVGRTATLTSKRCILYIYSTNVGTEYFKHALYSTFFFSSKCSLFHNANLFGSCIIHMLYTGCAKIKNNNNSSAKGLTDKLTLTVMLCFD